MIDESMIGPIHRSSISSHRFRRSGIVSLTNFIEQNDPAVWRAIADEMERQQDGLEMIASENYTSPAVMQAAGSVLTNKYAEGYPGKRYYGGCEFVDVVEQLAHRSGEAAVRGRARQRAAALRLAGQHGGLSHGAGAGRHGARARPGPRRTSDARHDAEHLGHALQLRAATACTRDTHRIDFDQVAALAREHKPKLIVAGASAYPREIPHAQVRRDRPRGRREADGRHGPLRRPGRGGAARQSGAGRRLRDDDDAQDAARPAGRACACAKEEYGKTINSRVFPGIQGGPLMHVIAGKAVCFGEALQPEFKKYAQQIIDNAKTLAETLLAGGLKLVSGGTDNHLMLVDVTPLGIGGKLAETALDRCGITVNKNMIPYDERKPMDPVGHPRSARRR